MPVRRIAACVAVASLSCLAVASSPLFAQTDFKTNIAAAKRVSGVNTATPRSRAPLPASSPQGKIDRPIQPITIYYRSYGGPSDKPAAPDRKAAGITEAPKQFVSLKPITIYYRVAGPAPTGPTSKTVEAIRSQTKSASSNTLMNAAAPSPASIQPKQNAGGTTPSELGSSGHVKQQDSPPATTQVPPAGTPAAEDVEARVVIPAPEVAKASGDNESTVASGIIDKDKTNSEPRPLETEPEVQLAKPDAVAGSKPATEQSTASVEQASLGSAESAAKSSVDTKKIPPALSANDAVVLNHYAIQLTSEARYEEAARLLKRAIGLNPNIFGLHRNLSIVYENMRKMDEALASAENAVKLAPSEPSALVQLCGLELLIGQNVQSLACYEKLRTLAPLDTLSQTFYGVALLRSDRSSDAIGVLEKAVSADASNAAALNALGVAHFNDKKYEDAVGFFKRAVEINPDHGEIRFNLAIAHLALRNKEGAMSQYRLLKEEDPKIADRLYRVLFRNKIVFLDKLEAP